MRDPVLASSVETPRIGRHAARFFRVLGGLHFIKGNHAPYFSLTMEAGFKTPAMRIDSCGAGHEEILRRFPRFADLAALHLSDINGEPMSAAENGVYRLAGCDPGLFREEYHAGNEEYRVRSDEAIRKAAREHFRISDQELSDLLGRVSDAVIPILALHSRRCVPEEEIRKTSRAVVAAFCEEMRPRWKAEADACIEKHGLVIYGDPWTPAPVELAEVTR